MTGDKLHFSTANNVWFIELMGTGYHTAPDKTHEMDLDKTLMIPDRDGKQLAFT